MNEQAKSQTLLTSLTAGLGFISGFIIGCDTNERAVVKACIYLGGFEHEDKVYTCDRIKPEPILPNSGQPEKDRSDYQGGTPESRAGHILLGY